MLVKEKDGEKNNIILFMLYLGVQYHYCFLLLLYTYALITQLSRLATGC